MLKIQRHKRSIPTLTEIYDIFDKMDVSSLRKILRKETDELDDTVKAQVIELQRIADEVGWGKDGLLKAVKMELEKRE